MPTKAEEYRDVIEQWIRWWDGPGRHHYRYPVIPPITATQEAIACIICAGIENDERCQACGRMMEAPPPGASRVTR